VLVWPTPAGTHRLTGADEGGTATRFHPLGALTGGRWSRSVRGVTDSAGNSPFRVLASGATELWAGRVRRGDKLAALGDAALEVERPMHVAGQDSERTLCGQRVDDLREYPVDFPSLEPRLRCPLCDAKLGHPEAR